MNKSYFAKDIIIRYHDYIKGYKGNLNAVFTDFASLEDESNGSLIWISSLNQISASYLEFGFNASTIICENDDNEICLKEHQCVIFTTSPRLLFAKIITDYFSVKEVNIINSSAIISPSAILGNNVNIGHNCIIEDNVIIGDNSILEGNNHVYSNVVVGNNVILQSGSVVGTEVMSFVHDLDGTFLRFPTFGSVIIEDNVEVGGNSVIVKSSLGKTRIGFGTKINSNSYIGSNVSIGHNNYIAANVIINGSCVIGNNNYIGAGAIFKNKLRIGSNNTFGAGAVVIKNICDNLVVVGNPAKPSNSAKGVIL